MTKRQILQLGGALIRCLKLTVFVAVLVALISPLEQSRIPTTLERVLEEGKIRVITRNGPTTYYESADGFTGFEYILASNFARHLGVELEVVEEDELGVMLNTIGTEFGHFAAAGLSVTEKRRQRMHFSAPYLEVTQKLIYRAGSPRPKSVEDLIGKRLVIIGDSSHEENLQRLHKQYPELDWEARHDLEMLELLELVHLGEIDFTIVDSNAYDINNTLYPRARVAFDISEPEQLAWAFPKHLDNSLLNAANKFFSQSGTTQLIADSVETFYGHVGELDYSGSLLFTQRMNSRLPRWKDKLQAAAEQTELDWRLLAALSYQESHWNPRAVSPTGVRGFMMLTQTTAKEMGVANRLDADQSISGGARYFKRIYKRIPQRIADPDRTWLALAAYNIGFGHLEDARILTEHFGKNPDKWSDVKEHLFMLAKRKYYKSTKHGYARGWEAVDYVQNIRNFYSIIAWSEKVEIEEQLALTKHQVIYADFSQEMTEALRDLSTPSIAL